MTPGRRDGERRGHAFARTLGVCVAILLVVLLAVGVLRSWRLAAAIGFLVFTGAGVVAMAVYAVHHLKSPDDAGR